MKIERVPEHRRNPDPRPFILIDTLIDGRWLLFIGWWKITLRGERW